MTEPDRIAALQAENERLAALLERIIDFIDAGHPALPRIWDKRQRGYGIECFRNSPHFAPMRQ